jgi:tripartite-type tricarboxylate transporter receptor subunit TctC
VSSFVVVAPGIYSKLAYDSVKDFVPITQILSGPLVLVAHPSFPPRTVAEVIRLAHSKPDAISYGSPGNGSIGHLASEMFRSMSGARMIHIPYRGSPPAYTDLLAGQIAIYMGTMTAALPLIKAGRLKALATTGQVRERLLPEVPTVAESGLKNFEVMTWYGVMAPAGVPQAIIGRIHADVTRVIRQTEIREQFASEGGAVVANTPEQFGAVIERELLKWSKVAKAAGAKVD